MFPSIIVTFKKFCLFAKYPSFVSDVFDLTEVRKGREKY